MFNNEKITFELCFSTRTAGLVPEIATRHGDDLTYAIKLDVWRRLM